MRFFLIFIGGVALVSTSESKVLTALGTAAVSVGLAQLIKGT